MLTRRLFMRGAAAAGCSAAAAPLITPVTLMAAPWEERLVVIILRGAMDGIDALRPLGDPAFAALRPTLAAGEARGLDDFWALHPALDPLLPLWQAGQLAFVPAVSTPYRDKRSHFDGQALLEAGTGSDLAPGQARDGWLNRMLGAIPGTTAETAYAIGQDGLLVLAGAAGVLRWSPEARLTLSPQSRLLLEHMYHDDALFRDAGMQAMMIADAVAAEGAMGGQATGPAAQLAAFAAERLKEETRIAAFSIAGWDTHRDQARALPRALGQLAAAIGTLREGLGPVWDRTAVLAMTEFGRTARENGTGGTDHGTGGTLVAAGGAIHGGRVLGRWPGLADADLYAGRDVMPTADVRAVAGWAMRGLFGLDRGLVEQRIFPGLDLGADPGLVA
ncbi:MAG: DUF1501 domain-containing protein [Rhodobacteraceae bacterium]|jgi:uncharacterized protein (DUF1501 family)|nr:DUF1501 domain-containing protein [Paracoccaceae bacterium]